MAPDPAVDFIGALRYLIGLEEDNAQRLTSLEEKTGARETFTVKDLANRWGCHPSTLFRDPWRLPNFGRADMGRSPKRWHADTVLEWEVVPEEEHRKEWEILSADDKRKWLGVSA